MLYVYTFHTYNFSNLHNVEIFSTTIKGGIYYCVINLFITLNLFYIIYYL